MLPRLLIFHHTPKTGFLPNRVIMVPYLATISLTLKHWFDGGPEPCKSASYRQKDCDITQILFWMLKYHKERKIKALPCWKIGMYKTEQ